MNKVEKEQIYKLEPPYTAGEDVKWYGKDEKQHGSSPPKN